MRNLIAIAVSIGILFAADQSNGAADEVTTAPMRSASTDAIDTRLERYTKRCQANPSRYSGDALTIANLNLTLCPDEVIEIIKRQTTLKPVNLDIPDVCVFYTEAGALRGKGVLAMCDDEGNLVALMLSCNVTDTCTMSVDEIARSMADGLPDIDELDVSNDPHAMFEGSARTGETIKLNAIKEILIERGRLGSIRTRQESSGDEA